MAATDINTSLLQSHITGSNALAGVVASNDSKQMALNAQKILGSSINLSYMMNMGNMDLHEGAPHSTTGIPYAISGSATLINQKVAIALAGFRDPIKAILGTEVHPKKYVIISRKWVAGGPALITPEHAPARVPSIQEDSRKIELLRYGCDLDMNLNLFLIEEKAREELEMKLDAQRLQLEQTLVSIGYDAIRDHGTNLVYALQRSRSVSGLLSSRARAIEAENIYKDICGCISKADWAWPQLWAIIQEAGVYTPNSATSKAPPVGIVPRGMINIKYTKPTEMNFSVSGLTGKEHGKIPLPMKDAFVDETTGVRLLIHKPPVSYQHGAAHPQVKSDELERVINIASYYVETEPGETYDNDFHDCVVTDFANGQWKRLPSIHAAVAGGKPKFGLNSGDEANRYCWWLRPQMSIMAAGMILCVEPGSETGSLLMAYPSTGISTSQTTEKMHMQLRVYFGAVIKQPENIFYIPDIMFKGLMGGHGAHTNLFDGEYDEEVDDLVAFCTKAAPWDITELWKDSGFKQQCGSYGLFDGLFDLGADQFAEVQRTHDVPVVWYAGTIREIKTTQYRMFNRGHLDRLDDPEFGKTVYRRFLFLGSLFLAWGLRCALFPLFLAWVLRCALSPLFLAWVLRCALSLIAFLGAFSGGGEDRISPRRRRSQH